VAAGRRPATMKASRPTRAPLPPEWAFVIQLSGVTDLERGRMEGRVEHIVSGEATRFDSLDALVDFLARVLPANQPAGLR